MLVKDFIDINKDILLTPVNEVAFHSLTDGTVLFCITATNGAKPFEERNVRNAGYHMVVATCREIEETAAVQHINTLALTMNGYAKVEIITPTDISGAGNKRLFRCRPLPINDPRRNGKFL